MLYDVLKEVFAHPSTAVDIYGKPESKILLTAILICNAITY